MKTHSLLFDKFTSLPIGSKPLLPFLFSSLHAALYKLFHAYSKHTHTGKERKKRKKGGRYNGHATNKFFPCAHQAFKKIYSRYFLAVVAAGINKGLSLSLSNHAYSSYPFAIFSTHTGV